MYSVQDRDITRCLGFGMVHVASCQLSTLYTIQLKRGQEMVLEQNLEYLSGHCMYGFCMVYLLLEFVEFLYKILK